MNPLDTTSWLPLNDLAAGFDANKAVPTRDLDGRTITTTGVEYALGGGEAFLVDDGLYYVQLPPRGLAATSLVLDLHAGRSLTVTSTIGEPLPGRTRVRQTFIAGIIDGIDATGPEPAPTTELVGRRALWVYSEQHAYEHIYLSAQWYTWQCLAGPERGLADTDENTAYRLRPGIYLFAWREKVVPCAAVTVADHRDIRSMRSHGALFGLDDSGQAPVLFTFGAFGRLLSTTTHPAELDPAGQAS